KLVEELGKHGKLTTLLSDRGYLGSQRIGELVSEGVEVQCKPWPSRNNGRYTKEDFELRLKENLVVCPAGVAAAISPETLVPRFPVATCTACPKREKCTA